MPESKPLVAVIMGSKSDWDTMKNAVETLDGLGVPNEARVLSAHRTPDATAEFARGAADHGLRVIIAGAGGAAHLAGVIAAHTWLPVLGVPIQSKLQGLDSLLSTAQMPGGIPVGTLAIGEAGAKNAALLAAAILATSDEAIRKKWEKERLRFWGRPWVPGRGIGILPIPAGWKPGPQLRRLNCCAKARLSRFQRKPCTGSQLMRLILLESQKFSKRRSARVSIH